MITRRGNSMRVSVKSTLLKTTKVTKNSYQFLMAASNPIMIELLILLVHFIYILIMTNFNESVSNGIVLIGNNVSCRVVCYYNSQD